MATETPRPSLRSILVVAQILLPLAVAHRHDHDAQIPIPHQEHKHGRDHKPKHNDSKHQHQHQHHQSHSRHGTQEETEWTGCLPGPLVHINHPSCAAVNHDEPSAEFAPWTHEPFCLPGSSPSSKEQTGSQPFVYCAFTNARYPSAAEGVSIIANPADAETEKSLSALASLFESLSSTSGSSDDSSEPGPSTTTTTAPSKATKKQEPAVPAYEVVPLDGKGLGLVARRKIKKGEVIMIDQAALIAETAFPSRVKRGVGRQLLERAVKRLSPQRRDMVFGLATSGTDLRGNRLDVKEEHGEEVDVEDVVRTNSFTVAVGGGSFMALFPRIARMNHACKPTAFTRFDEKTLSNTVLAFRDIAKGEEITISYSEFGLTHSERQPLLLSKWGFQCTCALCSAPPSERTASDARRLKIKGLAPQVISQVQSQNFGLAVELNREMVALIHEEGLVPHRGEHWEVMARLLLADGSVKASRGDVEGRKKVVKEAKKYLRLAIREIEEFGGGWGDDAGEGEDKIEELKGWLGKL